MNPQPPPRERPILFSGPMVRAILDGRKTQTRRVIKPQPEQCGFGRNAQVKPYCTGTDWPLAYYEMRGACWNSSKPLECPYGKPGDRLWVRETFRLTTSNDCACYEPCSCKTGLPVYRADDSYPTMDKWKPSIFMPRWASRITLELTAVRVHRVQEISEEDAMAEGIELMNVTREDSHRFHYRVLWDDLNLKRGFGWKTNPWVWALTFKRV